MTADKNQQAWHATTVMTRAEVIAECRGSQHKHEISDACAPATVRLHGNSRNLTVAAFILRGALLPGDDGYPHVPSAVDGGTKLWRMLSGSYGYKSRDNRLMADMVGTYRVNSATAPDGRVAWAEDGDRSRPRASP